MGNLAWGHGYHQGFSDGVEQGGLIGSVVAVGAGALVFGGKWAAGKLRDRNLARIEALDIGSEESRPSKNDPRDDSVQG